MESLSDCCGGGAASALAVARTSSPPRALREVILQVDGVTCGACVARVEGALLALPAVQAAELNLGNRRARVVVDADTPIDDLAAALARAGYRARDASAGAAERRAEARRSLLRVALAGFAMMQVMMFAVPVYVAGEGTLPWDVERLFALASLVLTVPVLGYCAQPIFTAAWHGMVTLRPGMDLPVAIGLLVTFAASVHATFGGGDVYYDSITMFVFLLLAARHVESRALARMAGADQALAALLPRQARRRVGTEIERVDPSRLAVGDSVIVAVGEAAPADLVLSDGPTEFDEALVTGESAPVPKRPGDRILAGTVNLVTPVEAVVERTGPDQTLEHIRRLVDRAAAHKPRWAIAAEWIAGRFALAVIALAGVGALAWLWIDPSRALWIAVTTLIVTCPCALSLATPAAYTAAVNALARCGVLVTRGRALESLASITHFVFDKTGTLTSGRMRLAAVELLGELDREECVAIAAALESALPHPMAHALVAEHRARSMAAAQLRAVPGAGVEGVVAGRRYRVGSIDHCAGLCHRPMPPGFALRDGPVAALASEEGWLAIFAFEDALRPDAAALVERLRSEGAEIVLLSGDRPAVVESVAKALAIDTYFASASPEAKAATLARLAASGARIAMVGDGVNDAPVLAQAEVAVALGQGAAAAQSHADFVLVKPSLLALHDAVAIARRTRAIVRQNLAWAAAYNAVTLPLALAGMLTPWIASVGMSLSSLLVVANALRLARTPGVPISMGPSKWKSSTS